MLIIASFLLSMSGCGYKTTPYYEKEVIHSDANIKFILEKEKSVSDESCK